jgi:hypothetical protein
MFHCFRAESGASGYLREFEFAPRSTQGGQPTFPAGRGPAARCHLRTLRLLRLASRTKCGHHGNQPSGGPMPSDLAKFWDGLVPLMGICTGWRPEIRRPNYEAQLLARLARAEAIQRQAAVLGVQTRQGQMLAALPTPGIRDNTVNRLLLSRAPSTTGQACPWLCSCGQPQSSLAREPQIHPLRARLGHAECSFPQRLRIRSFEFQRRGRRRPCQVPGAGFLQELKVETDGRARPWGCVW